MDADHMKILKALRNKAITALAQMDPEKLANNIGELRMWVVDLIRLERLVMGEPDSIEERREKLLDEGAIRLDGQPALLAGEDQDQGGDGEDEMFTYDEPDDE